MDEPLIAIWYTWNTDSTDLKMMEINLVYDVATGTYRHDIQIYKDGGK